jgi:hypothetical protein
MPPLPLEELELELEPEPPGCAPGPGDCCAAATPNAIANIAEQVIALPTAFPDARFFIAPITFMLTCRIEGHRT